MKRGETNQGRKQEESGIGVFGDGESDFDVGEGRSKRDGGQLGTGTVNGLLILFHNLMRVSQCILPLPCILPLWVSSPFD